MRTRTNVSRWARGLALATLLGTGLAQADRTGGYPISQGATADRFSFGDRPGKVLRVPNPAVWRDGRLHVMTFADRRHYAEASASASSTLRNDGPFVARFGKIVAKVTVENGSWTEESAATGISFSSLYGKREKKAMHEMEDAIEMASRVLPHVNRDPASFRFDSDGKIVHWSVTPELGKGESTDFSLVKLIGEGANAKAYEVVSKNPRSKQFQVLKMLKPYAPRRMPSAAPEATLEALSKEAEYLSTLFAKDPGFVKRFGNIIPETRAIAPGVIVQEMARGERFDDLGLSAQKLAREEIAELRSMAKRLAPGVLVTGRPQNYLFAKDGKIASLYDIASDGHRAYQKAGLSARVFAHRGERGEN